jgi:hypothetical protein
VALPSVYGANHPPFAVFRFARQGGHGSARSAVDDGTGPIEFY